MSKFEIYFEEASKVIIEAETIREARDKFLEGDYSAKDERYLEMKHYEITEIEE